jgi:hypothetical protein
MWRVISVYLCIYSCMGGLLYFHAALQWNHHRRKETSAKMGQPTTHFQAVSRRHTLKIQPAAHVETGSSGVHPTERNREPSSESSLHTALSSISKTLQPWRNISVDGDPGNAIPIRVNFPWMLFTILYIFGRVFIYVEDLMSLRSQPAGVYISVNRFLPFLG